HPCLLFFFTVKNTSNLSKASIGNSGAVLGMRSTIDRKAISLLLPFIFLLLLSLSALAQTQTRGRIAGTVKDQSGAVIAGAEVTVLSRATGDERKATTDGEGGYAVPFLPSATYLVRV